MRRSTLALGILIAAAAATAAVRGDDERAPSPPPVAVFAALEGTWHGTFVGPDGDEEIVWSTDAPEWSETFRETFREAVRREGDAWNYSIDGMGRYGDTRVLMCGRYRRD